ncbi:MAG: hypothetical protein IAE78_01170, partial [Myxococcus sp.]|nr:hypothetical protein [Myxococcus sp.]
MNRLLSVLLAASVVAVTTGCPNRPQAFEHGGPGRVFVLRGDLVSEQTRATLLGAARAVM